MGFTSAAYLPDDKIPIRGVSVGPPFNPFSRRDFGTLPLCAPTRKSANASFDIRFRSNQDHITLCTTKMRPKRAKSLMNAIDAGWWFELSATELHSFGQFGLREMTEYFVFTHFTFDFEFLGSHVTSFNLSCSVPKPLAVNETITYTYSTNWREVHTGKHGSIDSEFFDNSFRRLSFVVSVLVTLTLVLLATKMINMIPEKDRESSIPFISNHLTARWKSIQTSVLAIPHHPETVIVSVTVGINILAAFAMWLLTQPNFEARLVVNLMLVCGSSLSGLFCGFVSRKMHLVSIYGVASVSACIIPSVILIFDVIQEHFGREAGWNNCLTIKSLKNAANLLIMMELVTFITSKIAFEFTDKNGHNGTKSTHSTVKSWPFSVFTSVCFLMRDKTSSRMFE